MTAFVNWNGTIIKEDQVTISPNNRSFRYGDGCFETLKIINSKIVLQKSHFERLLSSLHTLKFSIPQSFTSENLSLQILELVNKNKLSALARVRLVVYRGDGGLYDYSDNHPHYIIQSQAGNEASNYFNEKGLLTDFYMEAKKTSDAFSSLKTNNFLPYCMGAIWAQQNNLDDCLLLNESNRIADATIANIFIIADGVIKTPLLTEGCINGVMRKYLISAFKSDGIPVFECKIEPSELLTADEVFLTNVINGIRWVQKVGIRNCNNEMCYALYQKFITPLFNSATF